jgi:hypothetical protein
LLIKVFKTLLWTGQATETTLLSLYRELIK